MNQSISKLRARRANGQSGFTLIELLVVIIILGILAAVVVFAVNGVGDKGDSAAAAVDARTLRTAEEAYCAQNGGYADQTDLVQEGFLSEASTIHDVVVQQTGGTCNGERFLVTCDPAAATCGQNGTTPDGGFDGGEDTSDAGTWSRGPDLPAALDGLGTSSPSMVAMPNGKMLLWGNNSAAQNPGNTTNPTHCRQALDPECPPPAGGQTFGPWLPGPIMVFDPAANSWSSVTNQLPGAPYPDWNPLWGSVQMLVLKGGPAECGSNCNKVLVQAPVGATQPRFVLPSYLNSEFFLFDPVAFDQAAYPWTRVADPTTTNAAGFVVGSAAPMGQIENCSRATAPDCGKVMLFPTPTDKNGGPPARTNDRFRWVRWDPADPAGPGSVAAWSIATPGARVTAANGTTTNVAPNQNIVSSPTANFTSGDINKLITGTGIPARTNIVSVTNSTTAVISQNATSSGTTRVFTIGTSEGAAGNAKVQALANGRLLAYSGNGSDVYNPVTLSWESPSPNTLQMTYTCPPSALARPQNGDTDPTAKPLLVRPDGKVVVVGSGLIGCQSGHPNSVVYEPASNTWSTLPEPSNCPCGSTMPIVVRTGGAGSVYADRGLMWGGGAPSSSLFDNVSQTWVPVPSTFSGEIPGRLPDGRVIVAGNGNQTWIFTPPVG